MNVGTSVSRVGGSAQIKAMKAVSGGLKLDLANFRELEAFAAFGADSLDKASPGVIARGQRLVELLKQTNGAPLRVEEQVVSHLRRHPRLPRRPRRSPTSAASSPSSSRTCAAATARRSPTPSAPAKCCPRTSSRPRSTTSRTASQPSETGRSSHGRAARSGRCADASSRCRVHEEDHAGHGAHRRQPDRQGPAAGRRRPPLQRADHRGDPQPLGRRRRRRSARCSPSATTCGRSAVVVLTADRGLAGGYNSRHQAGRERRRRPRSAAGRTVQARPWSARASSTSATAGYGIEASFTGFTDAPTYEDAREIAAAVVAASRPATSTGRARLHRSSSRSATQTPVLRRFLPARGRRHRPSGPRPAGPTADYEFEPGTRRHPRPPAPPLRREPAVRRPPRRRRLRARRPPAGHEVRHRQRRRAHQAPRAAR